MKKIISSFLALIMVMGIFSGMVIFSSHAVDEFDDSNYIYTQLPGIQDWTEETVTTYNTVTDAKAKNCGTSASLVTTHTKGAATQAIKLTLNGTPNNWSATFSTKGAIDDIVESQLGDVFGEYNTFRDIAEFNGIRVAIVNENGERPVLSTSDEAANLSVSLRIVGTESNEYGASWANGCVPWLTGTYYEAKKDGSAIAESEAIVYHNGYFYFNFDDFKSGWNSKSMREQLASGQWNWMWKYSNMLITLNGTSGLNSAASNGGAIYVSDMQFFTIKDPENKAELELLVNELAPKYSEGRYALALSEATEILNNKKAKEEEIAVAIELLTKVKESTESTNDTYYYKADSVPAFQEWTSDDCITHNTASQSTVSISDIATVGSATQSIEVNEYNGKFIVSNCDAGASINTAPKFGDPFKGYYDQFGKYDGMRVAITDKYGLTPVINEDTTITFKLHGNHDASGPVPTFAVTLGAEDLTFDEGYAYFDFTEMLPNWSSSKNFSLIAYSSWYPRYQLFEITLSGGSVADNTPLYFSDFQLYTKNEIAPREPLVDLIAKIEALDSDALYTAELEAAKSICDDITASEEDISDAVELLSEIYLSLTNDEGNFNSNDIVSSFGAVADPKEKAGNESVKLLMIGNSFSCNAFNYIKQIAEKADINLIAANLNIGGCNLERHYKCLINDTKDYGYQNTWASTGDYSISMALADQDWDYISIQQVSGYSGDYDSYQPYLHEIVTRLREMAPQAEIIWHQTWAYHQNSNHSDFPKYDRDQDKMWAAIEETSKKAAQVEGINYIVPSGKAFQLVRETSYGDNLTSDGYHANAVGEYIAGHTFLSTITGVMPNANSYMPKGITAEEHKLINNAIIEAVTEYGYINYDKNSKYLQSIRTLLDASKGSLDGMMVAGNLVTESSGDLNSFKAITLNVLKNSNVMYTLGELDMATNKNAHLVFSTLLGDFSKNDTVSTSLKRKGFRHFEVDGIHMFGVPYESVNNGFATYSDTALEWLDGELAKIQNGKPIFIVTSFPVTYTSGSVGRSRICSVLEKYENIICFSGGVSDNLNKDIIVHYDSFVSVNVGSLADENSNGMLVEVDSDGNVRIRRFDFSTSEELARYIINFDGSNISDYLEGDYETPVINLEDGASFDLVDGEPAVTWLQDGASATLNGIAYEYGAPITEAGEYILTVTAGTASSSVTFTVADTRVTYKKGDFDGDELITVSDALAALRIAAKMAEGDETALLIGDIDADGEITVSDALAILRVAAKMADSL